MSPASPRSTIAHRRNAMPFIFCFRLHVWQARGEPAKGHPVVRRLLSLRALLGDMSTLDEKMAPQVELLLRALSSGVDLAGAAGDDSDDDESDMVDADEPRGEHLRKSRSVRFNGSSSSSGEEEEEEDVDEKDLEEEEARFMGNPSGSGSSEEDEEDAADVAELSPGAAKKRRRAARKKALAETKAKVAAGNGTGDASLGDFGDEDADERSGNGGGGVHAGDNLLQGMVNRISQREKDAVSMKRRRGGLQGDLDVPIRERDQTIRVRRPVPGESSEEDGEGGSGVDSDADDLGLGGDGFLGGLPPGLLEGLGRRQGKNKKEEKRGRDGGGADEGSRHREEGDDFYAAVAEETERKKRAKKEKYHPEGRVAGALEAELEAERAARGDTKRGASYTIIKNRGLTPHKNKLNRNPRSKKREAFRKATIRRKGQVRKGGRGGEERGGVPAGEFLTIHKVAVCCTLSTVHACFLGLWFG